MTNRQKTQQALELMLTAADLQETCNIQTFEKEICERVLKGETAQIGLFVTKVRWIASHELQRVRDKWEIKDIPWYKQEILASTWKDAYLDVHRSYEKPTKTSHQKSPIIRLFETHSNGWLAGTFTAKS